jgi:uncharacterized protein (DUF1697 family)
MEADMGQYVALLRGINVGGKNLIKMPALAASFEALGYSHVRTYIQSGNVLFEAGDADPAKLASRLEKALASTFDYEASLVLRSHAEMRAIIDGAPDGFGSDPAAYRYDVLFLKEPLTVAEVLESFTPREGVDQVYGGPGVVYASRLISQATRSHLPRLIGTPIYRSMTIRNWNTTSKLLRLLEAEEY